MVPISFVILREGKEINYVLCAMIDSGSPVSLIKSNLLPSDAYDNKFAARSRVLRREFFAVASFGRF